MKKQFLMVLLAGLAIVQFGNAQEKKEEKKFGVKWGGYVKGEYIFDSRRTNNPREGQLMVFPLAENMKTIDGKEVDVNAESSFNSYAIESRLGASISGPDAFGMKTGGFIEAHFFGASNASINTLGLRHAFFTLSNDKVEILFGQYWHPNFVTNVSPGTHDFNAGLPFQSFNRSPQLRISTKGNVRFVGTLLTERDFTTNGGSVRFATVPTLNAQLQFGDDAKFVGGVGVNAKTVDMTSGTGVDNNKTSISFLGFAKANLGGAATWKVWGQYGGNTSELTNIAGYALKNNTTDEYLDAQVLNAWTEFSGKSGNMGWGIFAAYAMNNGFGEAVTGVIDSSIESAYRISPRLDWTSGKVRFGIELGYTGVQYAGVNPTNGELVTEGINSVGNFRSLLSATYFF